MNASGNYIPTFATPTKIKQQGIHQGQIRYKITFEDVPLESMEYQAICEVIANESRLRIEIYEA